MVLWAKFTRIELWRAQPECIVDDVVMRNGWAASVQLNNNPSVPRTIKDNKAYAPNQTNFFGRQRRHRSCRTNRQLRRPARCE